MKLFGLEISRASAEAPLHAKEGEIVSSQALAEVLAGGDELESGMTLRQSIRLSAVYACVRVLAESIGMLPVNLYQETDGKRKVARDNPLHRLVKQKPNDFMTGLEWRERVVADLCFNGNHYSFVNWVNDKPAELLPLPVRQVTANISPDYEVIYEVRKENGKRVLLTPKELLHIPLFTTDGITGLNPIQWNKNALGLARAAERHGSKVFANGAQASGGFKTEQRLNDEQFNRLKKQLDSMKGDGAHKSLILEGGLDWFQNQITAKDAQYLETRKYQRSEIAGIFRVPPHMIGDMERSTFSNIEHQSLDFVRHSLMPYITRIEARLNKTLLGDQAGYYFKFNANALLRGDMKSRAEFYKLLVETGVLSPNEVRELEDLNPREGGDIYLTPLNMAHNGKSLTESTPEKEDKLSDLLEALELKSIDELRALLGFKPKSQEVA